MKQFFDITENWRQKFKFLENEKRFYGEVVNKKSKSLFLKGFQVPKIVSGLRMRL